MSTSQDETCLAADRITNLTSTPWPGSWPGAPPRCLPGGAALSGQGAIRYARCGLELPPRAHGVPQSIRQRLPPGPVADTSASRQQMSLLEVRGRSRRRTRMPLRLRFRAEACYGHGLSTLSSWALSRRQNSARGWMFRSNGRQRTTFPLRSIAVWCGPDRRQGTCRSGPVCSQYRRAPRCRCSAGICERSRQFRPAGIDCAWTPGYPSGRPGRNCRRIKPSCRFVRRTRLRFHRLTAPPT